MIDPTLPSLDVSSGRIVVSNPLPDGVSLSPEAAVNYAANLLQAAAHAKGAALISKTEQRTDVRSYSCAE